MKFRNPRGDQIIEGRVPKKEDNFSEDRYYTDIENVFVRFDPYKDYIRIIFPSFSEIEFKIREAELEKLAKKDSSILDIIFACYNVREISKEPFIGTIPFEIDNECWFIRLDNKV